MGLSSARADLQGKDDAVVNVVPMLDRIPDWSKCLGVVDTADSLELIRQHGRTRRPAWSKSFIEGLTGRKLKRESPGPRWVISEKQN
jgi:putative transposase